MMFMKLLAVFSLFISRSNGYRGSFFRAPVRYGRNGLTMVASEISPTAEKIRNNLITLCDHYKEKEEQLRAVGIRRPRKLRDNSDLRSIERQIEINILKLSLENPNQSPLALWGQSGSCLLDGPWKLRFTTALDAKPELFNNNFNQIVSTSQYVNTSTGIITNIIKTVRKPDSLNSIIQVSVKGKPLSDNRLQLSFQTVNVRRPNALLLRNFNFPFPRIPFSNYWIDKRNARRPEKIVGPYFDILYLDEDLRIHRTGKGDYFVQTRVYDMWDPMVGWRQISLL